MTTWYMYPDDRRQAHVDAVMKDAKMRQEDLDKKSRAGTLVGYLAAGLQLEPTTGAQFDEHYSDPVEPINSLDA